MVEIGDAASNRAVPSLLCEHGDALVLIARLPPLYCSPRRVRRVVSMVMRFGLCVTMMGRGVLVMSGLVMVHRMRRLVLMRVTSGVLLMCMAVRIVRVRPGRMLGQLRLRVLMLPVGWPVMVMPKLRVQRDVQARPDFESDQPQRA